MFWIQNRNTVTVINIINYAAKVVNDYVVYDLNHWPRSPLNKSVVKNCLLGVTDVIKKMMKVTMSSMEQHLMEQAHGFLVKTVLELL